MAFVLSEQFKRHSFPYNSVFVSNFHYTAYYSVDVYKRQPYTPESTARMHHDYTLLNRHFIQKYNIRDDLAVPENFTQEPIFAFEPFDAEGLLRSIHQNFVPAPADAPYFFTAAMADTYIEDAVRLCTAELDRFHCRCV